MTYRFLSRLLYTLQISNYYEIGQGNALIFYIHLQYVALERLDGILSTSSSLNLREKPG